MSTDVKIQWTLRFELDHKWHFSEKWDSCYLKTKHNVHPRGLMKRNIGYKTTKLTADWAETCWSRLSYQDNYDRLTNCCCLVKPFPQIHTHTYTLACPHTVTTRRRLACPLTYHTNTYSTFRPSCPWKRANDCLTEDTMLLRHTFSHIHSHHTQWGLGRWLALGMELPPGFMSLGQSAVCSQLNNQVHIQSI